MANIATVLKSEITRLARKQSRAEVDALKKTSSAQRAEIASLKRRVQELEKAFKTLSKAMRGQAQLATGAEASEPDDEEAGQGRVRFSAKGMATNRKRLGLSAAEFGLLIGATEQSVYAWERGKTQPRARNLSAIAALRGIGKKEVAARLASLREAG